MAIVRQDADSGHPDLCQVHHARFAALSSCSSLPPSAWTPPGVPPSSSASSPSPLLVTKLSSSLLPSLPSPAQGSQRQHKNQEAYRCLHMHVLVMGRHENIIYTASSQCSGNFDFWEGMAVPPGSEAPSKLMKPPICSAVSLCRSCRGPRRCGAGDSLPAAPNLATESSQASSVPSISSSSPTPSLGSSPQPGACTGRGCRSALDAAGAAEA